MLACLQFLVLLTPEGDIKKTPITANYYNINKTGLNVMKVSLSLTL